jgi:2-polyprenyl-3-methyl-5-hydroxy-6-metoxy-1,4-benzoquinol methylase
VSDFDAEYEKTPAFFGTEPSPLVTAYGHLIPKAGRVLDIGVGQGRNAIPLAARGCRITGIDPSGIAIDTTAKKARDSALAIDLWKGSVFDYEADSAAFDAILLCGLIQILTREQISRLLARVDRWLVSEGLVFVTAWHVEDPRYEAMRSSSKEIGTHSYRRNDGEIRTYLERDEILTMFEGWTIIHHWEGLGTEHRHGNSPPERHGSIELVGRKMQKV